MKERIQYFEGKDKLTILILPLMKPIVRTGLAFIGLIVCGLSIVFAGVVLNSLVDMGFMALVFGSFAIFGFYLGTKYINRAFNKEMVEITRGSITITDKYLWNKKANTFAIHEIVGLDFVGRNKFTPHPLAGNSIDYTGFGVSETELQFIIEDGSIEIASKHEKRRFGKNVPSWDEEIIVERLTKFINGRTEEKNHVN